MLKSEAKGSDAKDINKCKAYTMHSTHNACTAFFFVKFLVCNHDDDDHDDDDDDGDDDDDVGDDDGDEYGDGGDDYDDDVDDDHDDDG
jgi:hypothetical protein